MRSSTQNGIRQHPQKHPNIQSPPTASHTSKPFSFSILVTIDWWQFGQLQAIGRSPPTAIVGYTVGKGCACCIVGLGDGTCW